MQVIIMRDTILSEQKIYNKTSLNEGDTYLKWYKIGMYGGKFLPFHKGHRYCIDVAAKECEKVYVILLWGGADEEKVLKNYPEEWLSVEKRTEQLEKICEEAGQYAEIISVRIDITKLRLPDGSEDWDAQTPLVRNVLG